MIVNALYISEAIYILITFIYNQLNLILIKEICLISKIFVAKNTDRIDLIFYCDNYPYNVSYKTILLVLRFENYTSI